MVLQFSAFALLLLFVILRRGIASAPSSRSPWWSMRSSMGSSRNLDRPDRIRQGTGGHQRKSRSNWVASQRRLACWKAKRSSGEARHFLQLLCKLVDGLRGLDCSWGAFDFVNHEVEPKVRGRNRDRFPLCRVPRDEIANIGWNVADTEALTKVLDAQVVSLNWLYSTSKHAVGSKRPTAAQLDGLGRLLCRTVAFIENLDRLLDDSWTCLLPQWAGDATGLSNAAPRLVASKVDVLDRAGLLDPTSELSAHLKEALQSEDGVFPQDFTPMKPALGVGGDRTEYIKLICRQIKAGQLGLVREAAGYGDVFPIGKKGSDKLRAVWNGGAVSSRAVKPPRPKNLASPTALLALHCGKDEQIFASKRDSSCWYDQLSLPKHLRKYTGRPSISVSEMMDIGHLSWDDLYNALEDKAESLHGTFVPVSLTWPMGLSWSSCVAQDYLLSLCDKADLGQQRILACDVRSPADMRLTFAAATDDVMIFAVNDRDLVCAAASRLDEVFEGEGVQRNRKKDVSGSTDATVVGVRLEQGRFLNAPAERCMCILAAILALLSDPRISPRDLSGLLGMIQWLDLLRRPKLSIFRVVYKFTKRVDDTVPAFGPL